MPGPVFLAGDRVHLRTVEEADLDALRAAMNDPAVRQHVGPWPPRTARGQREWFEEHASDDDTVQVVVAPDAKTTAGLATLRPVDDPHGECEVGLLLAPAHWGEGYGTAAARLLVDYAFADLRKHRVVARTDATNEASVRIWEKLGFRREARFEAARWRDGEWEDELVYAVLAEEWPA